MTLVPGFNVLVGVNISSNIISCFFPSKLSCSRSVRASLVPGQGFSAQQREYYGALTRARRAESDRTDGGLLLEDETGWRCCLLRNIRISIFEMQRRYVGLPKLAKGCWNGAR